MSVIEMTAENYDSLVSGGKPVLADFSAAWCGPCKMLSPLVDQLAEEKAGEITVCKVDIDEQGVLADRFGVESVPTLILFKNGQEADRLIGFRPISELRNFISR